MELIKSTDQCIGPGNEDDLVRLEVLHLHRRGHVLLDALVVFLGRPRLPVARILRF